MRVILINSGHFIKILDVHTFRIGSERILRPNYGQSSIDISLVQECVDVWVLKSIQL